MNLLSLHLDQIQFLTLSLSLLIHGLFLLAFLLDFLQCCHAFLVAEDLGMVECALDFFGPMQ